MSRKGEMSLNFSTCHKMQRLPWTFQVVTTRRSPDSATRESTQQDMFQVLHLPRKMMMEVSKALLRTNMQLIKRCSSMAPATQTDSQHIVRHLGMCQSATPATRNESTQRLKLARAKTSKSDRLCRTRHMQCHTALTHTAANSV